MFANDYDDAVSVMLSSIVVHGEPERPELKSVYGFW